MGPDDTSDDGDTGDTGDTGENPFAEAVEQGLADHVGTVEPSEVIVDGDTTHYRFDPADGPMCLRGGDYWMSVREGAAADSGDLLIYLQGGGACWSALCSAFESLGAPAVPESGMLNRGLAVNGFSDWNAVYVPYCDGSLFVGDVDIDDDDDGTIDRYHRGLINLSAALDVAVARYPDPQRVVLAGSSAGSYGTLVADMLVRTLWPEAELIVISDSGLGIGKPGDFEFIPGLLDEWDALRLVPASCQDCVTDHITGLPRWQLSRDPRLRFAAISSYDDAIIGGVFLGLGKGEYEQAFTTELAISAAAYPDRFHRFFFPGTLHTTISTDSVNGGGLQGITANYDTTVVQGTSVAQWLEMLILGDPGFGDRID
ncbi:MAG: hypothetical protein KC431_26880 [Myxococcales bacterium]|nr:hypothetical protein [Myxococcales bacterium]